MATTTRYDISRVNGPDPTPAKDPRVVGHRPTTVGGGKVTSPRTGRAKQQHAVTKRAPKSHIVVAKKAPTKLRPVKRVVPTTRKTYTIGDMNPTMSVGPINQVGKGKKSAVGTKIKVMNSQGGPYVKPPTSKVAPKIKEASIGRPTRIGNTYKPNTGMNSQGGPYVKPPTGATAPKMKETLLGRPVKAKAKR